MDILTLEYCQRFIWALDQKWHQKTGVIKIRSLSRTAISQFTLSWITDYGHSTLLLKCLSNSIVSVIHAFNVWADLIMAFSVTDGVLVSPAVGQCVNDAPHVPLFILHFFQDLKSVDMIENMEDMTEIEPSILKSAVLYRHNLLNNDASAWHNTRTGPSSTPFLRL